MKFPSKMTPYSDSTLSKFPIILTTLATHDMSVLELYHQVKPFIADLSEFLSILVCLYALHQIDYLEELGVLHYVNRNNE